MEKRIRQQLAWKQTAHTDAPRKGSALPYLSREQVLPQHWVEEVGRGNDASASPEDLDVPENDQADDNDHERLQKNWKRN